MDLTVEHQEGLQRIRHHLVHAAMGLDAYESIARAALGEEMYTHVADCLERTCAAINGWLRH